MNLNELAERFEKAGSDLITSIDAVTNAEIQKMAVKQELDCETSQLYFEGVVTGKNEKERDAYVRITLLLLFDRLYELEQALIFARSDLSAKEVEMSVCRNLLKIEQLKAGGVNEPD